NQNFQLLKNRLRHEILQTSADETFRGVDGDEHGDERRGILVGSSRSSRRGRRGRRSVRCGGPRGGCGGLGEYLAHHPEILLGERMIRLELERCLKSRGGATEILGVKQAFTQRQQGFAVRR